MGKRRLARKKATAETRRAKSGWALWAVAGAAVILVGGVIAFYIMRDMEAVARPGHSAPDFTLTLFDGKSVTLSDLKGKPVLLSFWGST
jgi:cytochrome oxidase Cu insertion factor (SCO1/SenC/PrrC family)